MQFHSVHFFAIPLTLTGNLIVLAPVRYDAETVLFYNGLSDTHYTLHITLPHITSDVAKRG
jgi:hypothetical protein